MRIRVSFPNWPSDPERVWTQALAQMGIDAEFHPDFDPTNPDDPWSGVVLSFQRVTLLPVAEVLRGFGKFFTGFRYEPSSTGAIFSPSQQGEELAALVCACALAAATGGVAFELESGKVASGSSGAELLEQFVPKGTLLSGPSRPTRFKNGWQV